MPPRESKNQYSAETLAALHRTGTGLWYAVNQFIDESMMRALEVRMVNVHVDGMTQMALAFSTLVRPFGIRCSSSTLRGRRR